MPIEQEQYYQRLWETNRETVQQHFWKNLAYTQSFSTREEVEKAARDCEISLPSALCPVLLRFWPGSPRWYYTVGGTTDDHASVHTRVNKAVQACLQTMDIPNIPCLSISVFGYHTSLLLFPAEHGNGPISYILKQLLACRDELALDMTLLLGAADRHICSMREWRLYEHFPIRRSTTTIRSFRYPLRRLAKSHRQPELLIWRNGYL